MIFNIFVAALFIHTDWHVHHVFGLGLTTVGFPLYAFGDMPDVGKKIRKRFALHYRHVLFLAIPALILFSEPTSRVLVNSQAIVPLNPVTTSTEVSDVIRKVDANPVHDSHVELNTEPAWVKSRRKLFPDDGVVRDLSIVRLPEPVGDKAVYMTSSYVQGRMPTDNYGNNVWKYTAMRVLPNFTTLDMCYYNKADRNQCSQKYPSTPVSATQH